MEKATNSSLQAWLTEINYKARVKAVCKPCWELKYCPYGVLVEQFTFGDFENDKTCRIYGHECPVFHVAEPFTETKELRNISRSISRPVQFRVLKRDNQICRSCGKAVLDEDIHLDHIIPWSKGGSSDEHNIQLLCSECNFKKGNKFEDEYLVKDLMERVSKPVGYEILEFLLFVVGFSHEFKAAKQHLPTADDFANELAGGEKTNAEITAAETFQNLSEFFENYPPAEIEGKLFNALSYRWGFQTGQLMALKEANGQYNVGLDALFTAELELIQRLGWQVKLSKKEQNKWIEN